MRAELSRKSKYHVPKYLYRECLYFCKQYPEWVKELSEYDTAVKGIVYDRDKIQTSSDGDSTAVIALRRFTIERKVKLVDDTINETASGVMRRWLLEGVTKDMSVWQLIGAGMPCGRTLYYDLRREFFWRLSRKM